MSWYLHWKCYHHRKCLNQQAHNKSPSQCSHLHMFQSLHSFLVLFIQEHFFLSNWKKITFYTLFYPTVFLLFWLRSIILSFLIDELSTIYLYFCFGPRKPKHKNRPYLEIKTFYCFFTPKKSCWNVKIYPRP